MIKYFTLRGPCALPSHILCHRESVALTRRGWLRQCNQHDE